MGSWRTWQDSLGQTSGWWSISVLSGSDTPPLGQLRGESTILLDEFKWGELADRHDEAPDGQVAVELPARYSNKYAAWRRVIILLNNSPATLYNAATGLDLAAFRRRVHRILYLDHRVESLEELEKLIDADNEYLFGINQFIL